MYNFCVGKRVCVLLEGEMQLLHLVMCVKQNIVTCSVTRWIVWLLFIFNVTSTSIVNTFVVVFRWLNRSGYYTIGRNRCVMEINPPFGVEYKHIQNVYKRPITFSHSPCQHFLLISPCASLSSVEKEDQTTRQPIIKPTKLHIRLYTTISNPLPSSS